MTHTGKARASVITLYTEPGSALHTALVDAFLIDYGFVAFEDAIAEILTVRPRVAVYEWTLRWARAVALA